MQTFENLKHFGSGDFLNFYLFCVSISNILLSFHIRVIRGKGTSVSPTLTRPPPLFFVFSFLLFIFPQSHFFPDLLASLPIL
jgi:hypothetical protein